MSLSNTLRDAWLEAKEIADAAYLEHLIASRELAISWGGNGRLKNNNAAAYANFLAADEAEKQAYTAFDRERTK